ncbi:hypothetical protein SAY87_001450 [Trapa incisa]|uniref:DUF7725 domain-containing protein n=1 Tax=Trapa incisa TaxID=236973 RepID=A0AAN7GKH1_9MYRT|nr:hypothetical protein SAY87_001450 [Trapa incisa]
MMVKSEITGIRNSFEAQVKEHADSFVKLREQLHEKRQVIQDFEKKIEEKDREFVAIKRDNEVAWAKEDILREQNKELATFRRELDHSEVERLQHIKQIHDLQEHLQDKERQLIEMQDQHRVSQETIIYKDEQLREALAWINRVQEMDALQSNSLQTELRTVVRRWRDSICIQYNRFNLNWLRQGGELDPLLTRPVPQVNSNEAPHFGQKDATQLDAYGSSSKSVSLSNSNLDNSYIGDHSSNLTLVSSPLLSTPGYIPTGQAQCGENYMSTGLKHDYQIAIERQIAQREHTDAHLSRETQADSVNSSVTGGSQVLESIEKNHLVSFKPEQILRQISTQFCDSLILHELPPDARSKLLNRLGKMLSPLHWHDYKKKYGKLDDFLASHPEYFEIDEDFIRLREGALEMIAAAAAAAKVASAAAAAKVASAAATTSSHSSILSSVAVTPMAQSYRPKSSASTDGKDVVPSAVDYHPSASQLLSAQNEHVNGPNLGSAGGPTAQNYPDVNSHGMQSTTNHNRENLGMDFWSYFNFKKIGRGCIHFSIYAFKCYSGDV